MKAEHQNANEPEVQEIDPALEQEYRVLARILLDFYREQQRLKSFPQDRFDKNIEPPTLLS